MKQKTFKIPADKIRPLARGHGACLASDEITIRGRKVGYAYREPPDNDLDSGWRFMAGDESDSFINDPDNVAIYDVNTIANYDRDIIPLLGAPVGSAFARDERSGEFVATGSPVDPEMS